jgi:hypothetical protein
MILRKPFGAGAKASWSTAHERVPGAGRQRRLRVDDEWFRIDLVFFHRRLRCLVLIDLKLSKLTAADVGQMHLDLNDARHHWTHPDENPPVRRDDGPGR